MNEEETTPVQSIEFGAEAPVTGQGRMEAAWGSSEGDEDFTISEVAQPAATGHVFEQVYKPWKGTLNPRWMRNWAILRHHLLGHGDPRQARPIDGVVRRVQGGGGRARRSGAG